MFGKIVLIAVLCIACTMAEAPVRYRAQRLRQAPPRQFFARQEAAPAPYPDSTGGEPAAEYGPPSTPKPEYGPPTTPAPQYGPPQPAGPGLAEVPSESSNPDSETLPQPSRLQSLPQKKPQKFSQRLELQQQVQQFPNQQVHQFPNQQVFGPFATPFQQPPFQQVLAAPIAAPVAARIATPIATPVATVQPVQFGAIQQEGSYYIQLPSGSIQRVNYITQPSVVDNSVLAKLQFRPVAEVHATVDEPQLYVNTVVQSQVSSDE